MPLLKCKNGPRVDGMNLKLISTLGNLEIDKKEKNHGKKICRYEEIFTPIFY